MTAKHSSNLQTKIVFCFPIQNYSVTDYLKQHKVIFFIYDASISTQSLNQSWITDLEKKNKN